MRRQKSRDRKKLRTKKLGEERVGGFLAQHRQQHLLSAGGGPLGQTGRVWMRVQYLSLLLFFRCSYGVKVNLLVSAHHKK